MVACWVGDVVTLTINTKRRSRLDFMNNDPIRNTVRYYIIVLLAVSIISTEAFSAEPQTAEEFLTRGNELHEQGQYDKAIIDYSDAIKLDPNNEVAIYHRGYTYLLKGKLENATIDFSKSIQLNPTNLKAYYFRGVILKEKKEYQKALADFSKVIEIDPKSALSVLSYHKRAIIWIILRNLDQAIQDSTSVIRLNPDFGAAYYLRGNSWQLKGNNKNAIRDFSVAVRFFPNTFELYESRAQCYEPIGELSLSIEDYSKAIELKPMNANLYIQRGIAYYLNKDYGDSINDFTQTIQYDPKLAVAYQNRAIAYQTIHKYKPAISDFKNVIRLDPSNYLIHDYLARLLSSAPEDELRDGTQAVESAKMSLKLSNGRHVEAIDTLAAAYAEIGDFDNAIKYQEEAIKKTTSPTVKKKYSARLRLYQQEKPYRLPQANPTESSIEPLVQ